MEWFELLKTFGITGIIVAGSVWLIRKITEQFFVKDLERFKTDLQKEAVEFKIRYERLHGEKAEVIKEVYARIVQTYKSFHSLMNPWQGAEEPTQEEKGKEAAMNANKLIDYFEQNRIFFDEGLARNIDSLLAKFKDAWGKFNLSRISKSVDDNKEFLQQWSLAWEQIQEKIPSVKKKLENKFRNVFSIQK